MRKFVLLSAKKVLVYYVMITFVSMLVFIPVDLLVYKEVFTINLEYFLVNLCVYTPFVFSCIFVVNVFNTRYNYLKLVYKFILEAIILSVILFFILLVSSYINYRLMGVEFTVKGWIELRSEKGYFFIDALESLFVLIFTKVVYLYDRQKMFELEQEKYKYAQLKHQLNPHFLFNSLNTLSAMTYNKNPDEITDYVSSLSDMYRYILNNEHKNFISLKDELIFVQNYIDILKERFGDDMIVEIDIKEDCKQKRILFMSLQLLIENAVKHNYASSECPLKIRIYEDNGMITVSNNINPKEDFDTKKSKIGLDNLQQRYMYYAKKNIEIENDGKVFTVKIPMI